LFLAAFSFALESLHLLILTLTYVPLHLFSNIGANPAFWQQNLGSVPPALFKLIILSEFKF
jgi:hypothetical protein